MASLFQSASFEALTRVDFFSQLPDELENSLEGQVAHWSVSTSSNTHQSTSKKVDAARQCLGTAKSIPASVARTKPRMPMVTVTRTKVRLLVTSSRRNPDTSAGAVPQQKPGRNVNEMHQQEHVIVGNTNKLLFKKLIIS